MSVETQILSTFVTQISTFVITLSAICLILPKKIGEFIFSCVLYALLVCITIVPIAHYCKQTYKWYWMLFKILILALNLYRYSENLGFRYWHFVSSATVLMMYVSVANIRESYNCDVTTFQLVTASSVSAVIYIILSLYFRG
jgi:hypothetical protein